MAGDPQNVNVWNDADIYIGELTAQDPASIDDPFGSGWSLAGLLDGEAGVVESEEFGTDEIMWSWGGVATRQVLARPLYSRTFTFHELNETTQDVIYPGSTAAKRYAARPKRVRLAFEFHDSEYGVIEREITAKHAVIRRDGDITRTESGIAVYQMRAVIFGDPQDVSEDTGAPAIWNVQRATASSS